MTTRREHDLLGDRDVPADAYYGVHTLRAIENFPITGTPISIYPDLIAALACDQAGRGARATTSSACSTTTRTDAIVAACEEIRAGKLHDQFVVDVIQGGAGTSTNMNANEVIANRALELLGHAQGRLRISAPERARQPEPDHQRRLSDGAQARAPMLGIVRLVDAHGGAAPARSRRRRDEFADVLKMGRTQLQDAVPMTLGQEFSTYAVMLGEDEQRLTRGRRA